MNFQQNFDPSSPPADETLRLIKAAVEHVSYSVMITTADLDPPGPRIVYITPAFTQMTGFTADEIVGKSPRIVQGPNTDRAVLKKMRKELQEGRAFTCELINYRKDRSEYVAELNIDPVRDAEGNVTHWVAVQHDVTERKRAEESLNQAERLAAIGVATAGLSHESRNALQRIQACLDELSEQLHDDPAAMEHINGIRHAQDDLLQLYEDVREFAAPIGLDLKTCYLDHILQDTWTTLALKREGRSVRFREHGNDVDLQCEVDEFALRQVFRNVFDNSLAACRDPIEIDVFYENTDLNGQSALRIALRDNGPGLSDEQRRKIFDQFYTTKKHGTGLGMAIVKRLLEAHGGRVAVDPDYQGGTSIVLTLPRRQT